MGSRQIVLVSTAGFSVLNTGVFWREAKTKRLFSQCGNTRTAGPPPTIAGHNRPKLHIYNYPGHAL
jgi:hypothetical protein